MQTKNMRNRDLTEVRGCVSNRTELKSKSSDCRAHILTTVLPRLLQLLKLSMSQSSFITKGSERKGSEVTQLCLTLCDPTDCSISGSSVHGVFQARVLEWVAIAFSGKEL